jgi:hypothetical protein
MRAMTDGSTEGIARAADLFFDASATTAASLELNGIPCVRALRVHAKERLHGCTVRILIDGVAAAPYERGLETVAAGASLAVDVSDFIVPLPVLRQSTEREPIDLIASLADASGRTIATARHRLAIVPASHWCGIVDACESLASFVTPNAPALRELLIAASRRLEKTTGNGALDGYLSQSPERAQRIAEACYEALAARGLTYITAKPSFEQQGQKVRTAGEALADGAGNCLDLSLTLAALLEAAGLAPAISMGDGHAVVGFATIDAPFADAVHDGPSRLVNRIDLGEFRAIESTGACGARLSYGQALAEGDRFLRSATEAMRVLDVRAARRAGFHPLPERIDAEAANSLATRRTPKTTAWTVVQPAGLPPLPKVRLAPHEARLEQWKKRLLDLTLRNRLLNDREKAGIPLILAGDASIARLEDVLWNEKTTKLVARGSARAGANDPEALADELARGWLRSTLEEGELFKRATKAFREARSSLEETGARSLYVAIGFLEYRVEARDSAVLAPLLLVPVEMERVSRSEGFRVVPVAEDTVPNVALVEYLRNAHGLDIGLSGAIGEDEHGIDVPAMLARVRQAVADVKGARVIAAAKLGNYSFKKLPLFEEMRARASELAKHPVVRTLLDREASPAIRNARLVSPDEVDAAAPFATVRLPLAADSSQIAAICSAAAGATFVLQGPPGTGKSQTITNLLSECLARGKRVLFIAEKSAALEVVSERLRKAGLGSFALDLHADHASKPSFVAQIKRSFEELESRAAPGSRQFGAVASGLDRVRARLQGACAALHGARGEGMTAHGAIQRSIELAPGADAAALKQVVDALSAALEGALPAKVAAQDLVARVTAAAELANAVDELPAGVAAALADLAPTRAIAPEQALALGAQARDGHARAALVRSASAELAREIGLAAPTTVDGAIKLLSVARAFTIDAPGAQHLVEAALAADHAARVAALRTSLALVAKADAAETEVAATYDRSVLELPIAQLVGDLRATREKFILFRWLAARKVRSQLVRLARSAPPTDHGGLLAHTEALLAQSEAIRTAAPHRAELARFARPDGPLDHAAVTRGLDLARDAAETLRAAFPRDAALVGAQAARAVAGGMIPAAIAALERPLAELVSLLRDLDGALRPTPELSAAAPGASLDGLAARLERIAAHDRELPAWSACTVARAAAAKLGLAPVAEAVLAGRLPTAAAERATECALLAAWTRARLREESALADCASDKIDEQRRTLATAIAEYRKGAADAVATLVRDRARAALAGADGNDAMRRALRTVQEIRALTTIRRPIRRVMVEGAPAIAALKPIVLASPLSANTLLPPEFPEFDLVVFDEASQVPVWDAACAISRGKASVIVGDSKQLPPTNFFDRKDPGGEGDGPASAGDAEAALADALEPLDSVLEEAIAASIPERYLLWHYRSRDERLIEFSNRKSYGSRLQTFPAAHRAHPNLGVEFRFVGGTYDRAGTSTNRAEAEAVVAELTRRLLDDDACSANRSIGVVTFSEAQQTLVQDLLDEAVDRDARLRERMAEAEKLGDPVFVKNLENVQGDERATMLFSICYGRDATGAMYHNFGPLNLSGGERRLNVAVTRAREKIVLFTSIRAGDLDPAKCRSKGAQDLRDYLAFAELGTVPASRNEGVAPREIDVSAIERALAAALEARGWAVDLHVGRSRDYRVSLAVAAKGAPEHWVLGVELDGAFYSAAPTVVDRELVRDGVLGSLGWRVIKVSCIDWMRDPRKVVDRIDQAARA